MGGGSASVVSLLREDIPLHMWDAARLFYDNRRGVAAAKVLLESEWDADLTYYLQKLRDEPE